MSERRGNRAIRWMSLMVTLAILACSACSGGSGGSSPTEPEAMGTLDINASVSAGSRTGFQEITLILDGEEVGGYLSPYPEGVPGVPSAIGTKRGIRSGFHRLAVRVDRMTAASAKVEVAVVLFYTPRPGAALETITPSARSKTIVPGESIELQFDL